MKRHLAGIGLLLAAALAVGLVILHTPWFVEWAKGRIVAEVSRVSGGRASLEKLDFNIFALTVRLDGFVLRGREAAGEPPLFAVRRIDARLSLALFAPPRLRLRSVRLEGARVRIQVYPDGRTNLPEPPGPPRAATPVEDLVRLRIGSIDIHQAHFETDARRLDFSAQAEDLAMRLAYERGKGRYGVDLSAGAVHLPGRLAPAIQVQAWLEGDRVEIVSGRARQGDSRVEWSGAIAHLKQPVIDAEYKVAALLRDIEASPVREGFASAAGRLHYDVAGGLRLTGDLRAEQLAFSARGVHVRRLAARGGFTLTPHWLEIGALALDSPYGRWEGRLRLEEWRRLELRGEALALNLANLQAAFLERPVDWDASISGPASFRAEVGLGGFTGARLDAALGVAPVEGHPPLTGQLEFTWRQECACVEFQTSSLATPSARVVFNGVLGERLEAGLFATRLDEIAPVITLLTRRPFEMPVSLDQGTAQVQAVITGPAGDLHVRATATAANAVYEGIRFERASATLRVDRARLDVSSFLLRQEGGQLSGTIALALDQWRPSASSAVRAGIEVNRADLPRLFRLARLHGDVRGSAVGAISLGGTLGALHGSVKLEAVGAGWRDEELGRLSLELALEAGGALRGRLARQETELAVAGAWTHPEGDFRNGSLRLQTKLAGFHTTDWAAFRKLPLAVESTLGAEAQLSLAVEDGVARLTSLNGKLEAPRIKAGRQEFGALQVSGTTTDGRLSLLARLDTAPGRAEMEGRVELSGHFPAEARLQVPGVSTAMIERLLADAGALEGEPWPLAGSLDIEAECRGRLDEPLSLSGHVRVGRLELRPAGAVGPENSRVAGDLTLRNSGPLLLAFDAKSVHVTAAQLSALETELALSGSYDFASVSPWNLEARGTANLAVLGSFYPGLIASGSGRLRAAIRGAAADPQMSGQMDVVKGAFFLKDIPNGIEDVNGTVYFEKNRANIQRLTGVSGGGTVGLSGFASFGRGGLAYRLQAGFTNVRVRYPEGVSNTLDANLTLTGAPAGSVLAGLITVKRSGFIVSGDLASMVGNAGNPIPAGAAQNEFLRNLQFDIRIRTAPDAVFVTSYTSDLQTEADLRLRGSPAKPVLLGSINANQGQVNFFGNRYTISRGEILFFNTATVLPQIDLDLETRLRGITVYLNVSGPLSRLNVNYRSEPPLQSSEILALLTVGRTPLATSSSVVASDRIRSQTVMENSAGSNTLLGGALTAGLNTRTERFFGASRIRIDPSAVGVDNLPQARLSIEQSISRDVAITFVTNLNRSQQQVVRLEWDLSRQWSLIAIKDENGSFAVDFLYRRRFQ